MQYPILTLPPKDLFTLRLRDARRQLVASEPSLGHPSLRFFGRYPDGVVVDLSYSSPDYRSLPPGQPHNPQAPGFYAKDGDASLPEDITLDFRMADFKPGIAGLRRLGLDTKGQRWIGRSANNTIYLPHLPPGLQMLTMYQSKERLGTIVVSRSDAAPYLPKGPQSSSNDVRKKR